MSLGAETPVSNTLLGDVGVAGPPHIASPTQSESAFGQHLKQLCTERRVRAERTNWTSYLLTKRTCHTSLCCCPLSPQAGKRHGILHGINNLQIPVLNNLIFTWHLFHNAMIDPIAKPLRPFGRTWPGIKRRQHPFGTLAPNPEPGHKAFSAQNGEWASTRKSALHLEPPGDEGDASPANFLQSSMRQR